ncbi:hypothetical protein E4U11_004400 [Claviceps purpurea]|nr:hypothetical protein E4U11_004400 [Claviceps purpurea]
MAGTAGAELKGELVAAIALAVDWFAAARDVVSTAGVAVLEMSLCPVPGPSQLSQDIMSPYWVSKIEPTMADLIGSGRQLCAARKYKAKNYRRALGLFTSAMKSCPCARDIKRGRCTCKDFEKVATQGGSIFREAMYTCHCDIGRTFSKCDNLHHIEALDFRAATFVALGELEHAMKDAEWMLELAPGLPDGYLRLGKIAQLQKNVEFAWNIYKSGIEANEETSLDTSSKLQQLHDACKPLNWRFNCRRDPLCLPAELVTHIFSYLTFDQILLCLRVSKQWTCTLTSPVHAPLWRDMTFESSYRVTKRFPSAEELRRILSWAGDGGARKIVTPLFMELNQSMLTVMLEASPSLEHLAIEELQSLIEFPSNGMIWNRLKYFSLRDGQFGIRYGRRVDEPGGFPHSFLQHSASSLEHLYFEGIPAQWYDREPLIPFLPKLKTLRMNEPLCGHIPLSIFHLSIAFPRLEQLFIGPNLLNLDSKPVAIWREKWGNVWPHLKVLVFHFDLHDFMGRSIIHQMKTLSTIRHLVCLNRGNSLQHIHFGFVAEEWSDILFSRSDDLLPGFSLAEYAEFQNLRSFRSNQFCMSPDGARSFLFNAMKTKQLTSFDIKFPKDGVSDRVGDASTRHLKAYEWARGAPSIQQLGCHGFRFGPNPKNDEDMPLPQFLATFPNLRTLILNSWMYYNDKPAEFLNLLLAILRCTHLETIYTGLVDNEPLKQAAGEHGVRVMGWHGLEQWPIPLGA